MYIRTFYNVLLVHTLGQKRNDVVGTWFYGKKKNISSYD